MNEFSTTDFQDTEPGGSTFVPASTYTDTMNQSDFLNLNEPVGNTSVNYVQPGAYTMDANGVKTPISDLSSLSKFIADNKGLLTAAGALTAMNSTPNADKRTGYQGTIPALTATRNMITAPPPTGYRPGQGGINYGGDVTYTRTPGLDPWWQTSGNSSYAGIGGSRDAGLTALLKAYQGIDGGSNLAALNSSIVGGNNALFTISNQNATAAAAAAAASKAAIDQQSAAAAAAAKAAADLAAAKAAGDAAAIAAAQKAAADAAAAKAAADAAAAKAAADAKAKADAAAAAKAAADKAAADAAAKAAADKAAADAAAKAAADAAARKATESSFLTSTSNLKKLNTPVASAYDINNWILNNTNASAADIAAAAKAGNVTNADIQRALSLSTFSPAVQNMILSGQGLDKLNANINQWVAGHPYATAAEIAAIKKASGVSDQDVANALTDKTASAGKEYALTHGMGLDEYYKNILDFQAKNPTAEQTAKAMKDSGVSQADIDAAAKFAQRQRDIEAYNAMNAPATQAVTQASSPNLNASLASILAERKAAAETPNLNNSLEAILAERKAAASTPSLDTGNDIYKYFANPETQSALASGNTRGIAETMQSLGWSPAEVAAATGVSTADVQAAYDAALSSPSKASAAEYVPDSTDYSYMQFAEGGMARGRYLQGETDGMADELPAKIGTDEPAALSHGEFVIPADVVSHLGNGNSDAGAKKLYQMMDKIRMARTGTKKQGKRINPDKFMPGGLAQAYAKGGKIKKYAGEASSMVTAGNQYNQGIQGIESNLSNWAGPYVTNMLGQGQALANMPYQSYMGQLTAGTSPLQNQAFNTASNLTTPTSIGTAASTAGDIATKAQGLTYTPTTTTFDKDQAAAYMNPYLESALKPQLEEARRQSQITQQQNAAKMTQAGAFGGGRQAILDAETQRALGANLANITGQGYSTAYDKAMAQFNADQARKMAEAQYGAGYGLQGLQTGLQAAQTQGQLGSTQAQTGLANLNAQLGAGATQRGIEAEGIAADKAQFEEARANPYKMVQFQQSLLQGLPLAAQSYQGIEPSALVKAAQGATTVNALLKNLGLI